jgi:NAD-dependent SIR2 family protein deacetylase
MEENIKKAAKAIDECDAMLITAGAGIGVDSGLPDFRGDEGFWKAYPPIAKLGISFVDMANPYWFEKDPKLAWAFYGHRLHLYRRTIPHDGFSLLLDIAQTKPGGYFVFTSNVDGQFQKAGYDSQHIQECHGSIHHFQCRKPCNNKIWDAIHIELDVDEENFTANDPLPACPDCGAQARPNILMFGDWYWLPHRTQVQQNNMQSWINKLISKKYQPVIIEMGAGEAVATVRHTSESLAHELQATLIRINPRDAYVSPGHVSISLGALEAIEKICAEIRLI